MQRKIADYSVRSALVFILIAAVLLTGLNVKISAAESGLEVYPAETGYGGTAVLTAVLTSGDSPVSGQTVSFTLDETPAGSAVTDETGTASVEFPLSDFAVGTYTITASFAGDAELDPAAGTAVLDVTPREITPHIMAESRAYDGTTDVNIEITVDKVEGDDLTVNYATAAFADAESGEDKVVTVTGLSLTGADAANYTLTEDTAFTTADIFKAVPSFSNLSAPAITHGDSPTVLEGYIAAGSLIPPGSVNITLDGIEQTASIDPDTGHFSASFDTAALVVGSYPINYSYPGDSNFDSTLDNSLSLTVGQATAVVTLEGLLQIYNGSPHPVTCITDPPGLDVVITYDGKSTPPTVAGTCTVQAVVNDPDYTGSATGTLVIAKAASSTQVSVEDAIYNGKPVIALARVTSEAGLSQVLTVTYRGRNGTVYGPSENAPVNAGDYTASATYPGDSNYTGSSDSRDFTISRATPVFSNLDSPSIVLGSANTSLGGRINPGGLIPTGNIDITLNGVKQTAVIDPETGEFSSSFTTGALKEGSYPLTYFYPGDANFNSISDSSRTLNVKKPASGGDFPGGNGGFPPVLPTPEPESVTLNGFAGTESLSVDASGKVLAAAELKTLDGKLMLGIPAGASLQDADGARLKTITATKKPFLSVQPPEGTVVLVYDLAPAGARFDPPLTLTLKYDADLLPRNVRQDSLCIAVWNGESWVKLASTRDAVAHTVSAELEHFSLYILLGENQPVNTPATPASTTPVVTTPPVTTPAPSNTPEETTPAGQQTTTPPTVEEPSGTGDIQDPAQEPSSDSPFSIYAVIMMVAFIIAAIVTVYFVLRRIYVSR